MADDGGAPRAEHGQALFDQVRWRAVLVLAATLLIAVEVVRLVVPLWAGLFHSAAMFHRARVSRYDAHALERRLESIDVVAIDARVVALEPRFVIASNRADAERRLRNQLTALFAAQPGVVVTIGADGDLAGLVTAEVVGRAHEPGWMSAIVQLRRALPQARATKLSVRHVERDGKLGPVDVRMTLIVPWAAKL